MQYVKHGQPSWGLRTFDSWLTKLAEMSASVKSAHGSYFDGPYLLAPGLEAFGLTLSGGKDRGRLQATTEQLFLALNQGCFVLNKIVANLLRKESIGESVRMYVVRQAGILRPIDARVHYWYARTFEQGLKMLR